MDIRDPRRADHLKPHHFKKGVSPNPGGVSKKMQSMQESLRELCKTLASEDALRIRQIIHEPDSEDHDRISAMNSISKLVKDHTIPEPEKTENKDYSQLTSKDTELGLAMLQKLMTDDKYKELREDAKKDMGRGDDKPESQK